MEDCFFLRSFIRGASGTMTGFAFTEILVEIYNLFSEDKITEAKDVFIMATTPAMKIL